MPVEMVAVMIPIITLMIPIVAIITAHKRKVLEMQMRAMSRTDAATSEELKAIRQQLSELRDTTTRYDVSFDSALQRLEGRMGAIEQRVGRLEQGAEVTQGRQG